MIIINIITFIVITIIIIIIFIIIVFINSIAIITDIIIIIHICYTVNREKKDWIRRTQREKKNERAPPTQCVWSTRSLKLEGKK